MILVVTLFEVCSMQNGKIVRSNRIIQVSICKKEITIKSRD